MFLHLVRRTSCHFTEVALERSPRFVEVEVEEKVNVDTQEPKIKIKGCESGRESKLEPLEVDPTEDFENRVSQPKPEPTPCFLCMIPDAPHE